MKKLLLKLFIVSFYIGAVQAQQYKQIAKWGGIGTSNSQFLAGPGAIAVDGQGYVYVTDGNRYKKFTNTGSFVAQWGATGQFNGLAGIAVDAQENVFVLDAGNYRVQKYSSTGTYITQFANHSVGVGNGYFINPRGLAIDGGGGIYVADDGVIVFNNSLQVIEQIKPQGVSYFPTNVAADNEGNVYVTDQISNIYKCNLSGQDLIGWGSEGSGPGQFLQAIGIALDVQGNVYVADQVNNRVQIFTNSGVFLATLGGTGTLTFPGGVAVDAQGYIYVTDQTTVQKFALCQQIITQPIGGTYCQGAQLTVSATGTNISYKWSNGATTSSTSLNTSGVYTVTVTGSCGNIVSTPVNVVVNPAPSGVALGIYNLTGSPVATPAFCSGSEFYAGVSGLEGGYGGSISYAGLPGSSVISGGGGPNGFSQLVKMGATPGSISATFSNNTTGCTTTLGQTIGVLFSPPSPLYTIEGTTVNGYVLSFCDSYLTNAPVAVTYPVGYSNYTAAWSLPLGATTTNGVYGSTGYSFKMSNYLGQVQLTYTDKTTGCSSFSATTVLGLTFCREEGPSAPANPQLNGLASPTYIVYPIPFSDSFTVGTSDGSSGEATIEVSDISGKIVARMASYSLGQPVPFGPTLPKGVFIVKVTGKETMVLRVVKD